MILILSSFLCIISCKNRNNAVKRKNISFTFIRSFESKATDTAQLLVLQDSSKLIYYYLSPYTQVEPDTFSYFLSYDSLNSSNLVFMEEDCPKVDSMIIGGEWIYKFLYDIVDGYDEEAYIFFNPRFGMLGYQEIAWNGGMAVQGLSIDITDSIKSKESCFFRYGCP